MRASIQSLDTVTKAQAFPDRLIRGLVAITSIGVLGVWLVVISVDETKLQRASTSSTPVPNTARTQLPNNDLGTELLDSSAVQFLQAIGVNSFLGPQPIIALIHYKAPQAEELLIQLEKSRRSRGGRTVTTYFLADTMMDHATQDNLVALACAGQQDGTIALLRELRDKGWRASNSWAEAATRARIIDPARFADCVRRRDTMHQAGLGFLIARRLRIFDSGPAFIVDSLFLRGPTGLATLQTLLGRSSLDRNN